VGCAGQWPIRPNRNLQWLTLLACSFLCVTVVRSEEASGPERSRDASTINVTVTGEVNVPGHYQLPANGSLNDLLQLAGGAKDMAADIVSLSHADGELHGRRFPINLKDKR
jgi:SLBB domain